MTRRPGLSKVLVTDGLWRKSLSAVRALAQTGEYSVLAGEMFHFSCALYSKFAAGAFVYPSPFTRPKSFLRVLASVVRRESVDVLLPMEETTLVRILQARDTLFRGVLLPFPPLGGLLRMRDKASVLQAALSAGVSIPKTLFPDEVSESALGRFPLPAVVKPRISSGGRGMRYAFDAPGLVRAYAEVDSRFPRPVVQEMLPRKGEGAGVSVLMGRDGSVLASFTHVRLRENPPSGGASTLRVSARIPEIEEAAHRLLRSAQWSGIAMVEFKKDVRDGAFKLMEVNPRFWGSLELAVRSGVNFPDLLVKWGQGRFNGPPPPYREGILCRWLLPGDILHFLANPDRFRLNPPFFRFRMPNMYYDIIRKDDPMPVLGAILSLIPVAASRELRRFLRR